MPLPFILAGITLAKVAAVAGTGIAVTTGIRAKAIADNAHTEGMCKGYERASYEYEEKLRKQADDFLAQSKVYESQRDEYEQLLDAYEREIESLTRKQNRTFEENSLLSEMKERKSQLVKIA
jgi:hypothetical protein